MRTVFICTERLPDSVSLSPLVSFVLSPPPLSLSPFPAHIFALALPASLIRIRAHARTHARTRQARRSIWLFLSSLKGCFEAMAPVSIGAQMSSLRQSPAIICRFISNRARERVVVGGAYTPITHSHSHTVKCFFLFFFKHSYVTRAHTHAQTGGGG